MKATGKVIAWTRKIAKRSKMALKRIVKPILRAIDAVDRNRPLKRGLYWELFDATLHSRDNRPKLYIQRYGKRD